MLKLYVKSQLAAAKLKKNIKENIEGASLIEYSILIGLITAAVIAFIVIMGNKVNNWWATLNANTGAAPTN